ncbi:MAG TPA: NAD-dependent epimerase/dehydratase family protein, partial [Flavobacteriales bacterium]|nr:NAD-dependent epimerase/dehydratase family protein [Flavobacteriales bacterium]
MNRVLVYGASSDQGIPLINALIRKGYNVRAVTRNPEKYKNEITSNIETIKADLYDIETLKEASKGVDSIAMNLPFVFDKSIAKEWGLNITSAAAEMGVRKIVFNTSCYVAPNDNGLEAHDGRRQIEKAIENSGMDYVVIRSLVFMDNLLRFWSKPSIV